jgi:hypothetical protein
VRTVDTFPPLLSNEILQRQAIEKFLLTLFLRELPLKTPQVKTKS